MRSIMKTSGFIVPVESVAADAMPESLICDLCDFANLIGAMVRCEVNGKLVVISAGADPHKVIDAWRSSPPASFFRSTTNLQPDKLKPSPHSSQGRREIEYRRMQWFGIALATPPALYLGLYAFALFLRKLVEWGPYNG